jgi:hypothetical protein
MYLFTTDKLINLDNNSVIKYEGSGIKLILGTDINPVYYCSEQTGLAFLIWLAKALEKNDEKVIWTLDFPGNKS